LSNENGKGARGGNEKITRVNWGRDKQRNLTCISNREFYWFRKWAKLFIAL